MTINDILLKEPFTRIIPSAIPYGDSAITDGRMIQVHNPKDIYRTVSQSLFLQEYFVTGHRIFNDVYYPNRIKQSEDGETYIHEVERVGIPFQKVIVTKRLAHLCGNNIEFSAPGNRDEVSFTQFKEGWIDKNMEIAFFKSAKSEMITGDCAFCGYMDSRGKFNYRIFSYLNGDILYPHLHPITGEISTFGRRYSQVDENGDSVPYLDVWDEKYVVTYRKASENFLANLKRKMFGGEDWIEVERYVHGFPFVPVTYHRSANGPAWSFVQDLIDKLELAISHLAENNKAYAFRILFLKGDNIDVKYDSDGLPNTIMADEASDARFLEKADVASSFDSQIKWYLQWIFMGSFTVMPPEVKSGDLPGVAIKLIYSPAVEQAMEEAMEWDGYIDGMTRIFKYGYGREIKKAAQFDNMTVRGEIIPYVHQNTSEIVNILNSSVLAGTLSQRTASQKHPEAVTGEIERIQSEAKEELNAPLSVGENKNNMALELNNQ